MISNVAVIVFDEVSPFELGVATLLIMGPCSQQCGRKSTEVRKLTVAAGRAREENRGQQPRGSSGAEEDVR